MSKETPEILAIDSLDEFALLIAAWHHNRVSQLEAALNAPDDVEIEFSMAEGAPPVVMNADNLAGFKAGLVMAMSLFAKLPFDAIPDDEEAKPEVPADV